MEKKKLKEIEAKLNKLLAQTKTSDESETTPLKNFSGTKVIRRRKGQMDIHFS